jgi:hypothetical protein
MIREPGFLARRYATDFEIEGSPDMPQTIAERRVLARIWHSPPIRKKICINGMFLLFRLASGCNRHPSDQVCWGQPKSGNRAARFPVYASQ